MANSIEPMDDLRVDLMHETDLFELNRIYKQRNVRFERSIWDTALLLQAVPIAASRGYSHHIYVARRNDYAVAFAVVAIADDGDPKRESFVIEFGGSVEGCVQLFVGVLKQHKLNKLQTTLSLYDKTDKALGMELANCGAERTDIRNSGTIRINTVHRLLEQAAPYLRGKSAAAFDNLSITALVESGDSLVSCSGSQAVLSVDQLVSLMFDEQPALPDLDPLLKKQLQRLFPLPFPYVSGLNYI